MGGHGSRQCTESHTKTQEAGVHVKVLEEGSHAKKGDTGDGIQETEYEARAARRISYLLSPVSSNACQVFEVLAAAAGHFDGLS